MAERSESEAQKANREKALLPLSTKGNELDLEDGSQRGAFAMRHLWLTFNLYKVEVLLDCKAGFNYFLELLHPESRPALDRISYPSHVANCDGILKEIEIRGGGIVLDVYDGDDRNEELVEDPIKGNEVATTAAQLTLAPELSVVLPSSAPDLSKAP
ncbi:uncharacterized protein A4U43_C05F11160 [Asparagus officinalis]|uniref:Uncharacterized protein n=1 Tax=Asparagus officinalis TaxID=4686 RepID=A0A5P1ERF6_ASPOF|nr:uncharacterized protein A4U43_C05F11160 [Asparagus officinalis]